MIYPTFKITKPIRIIELFGGYGSQLLALKYIGANVEQWKLCEWAIKSIQAYKDLHCSDDNTDYSKDLTIEEIKEYLYKKGISSNYNDPMTQAQVNRLGEKQARTIYNNIQATHNLVDIQQTKGKDLCIKDKDKFTYLLTYSFPCQDLSLAGNRKGMSDTATRSGLLWEVERILMECRELNQLPDVLLMENVPMVHGEGTKADFNKWQLKLEELGYKNYWKDLIATDYGIPQTRNRCFMVSILGDYNYTFPKPIPLKLKLKDMLDDNVDEKYYLSDKMINFFVSNEQKQKETGNGFRFNVTNGDTIAKTITTSAGSRMDDNFISPKVLGGIGEKDSNKNTQWKQQNRVYDDNVSIAVTTCYNPYYKMENKVKIVGNYSSSNHEASRIIDPNYVAPTFKENHNTINAIQQTDLKIRKLTPRECFRLMGVKDEDYEKIAKNQSDSSLYHLAGDSIVCQGVLTSIFKEMM